MKSRISHAALVGVWFYGLHVSAVRIGMLTVDGLDVTETIIKVLRRNPTDVIFLSGASFAGFNIIDLRKLYRKIGIPTIIVSREMPNNTSVRRALKKHFVDWRTRWRLVRELGRVYKFASIPQEEPLYLETIGLPVAVAKKIIRAYCVSSRIPEPIRVAGLLARGFAPAGNELQFTQ